VSEKKTLGDIYCLLSSVVICVPDVQPTRQVARKVFIFLRRFGLLSGI